MTALLTEADLDARLCRAAIAVLSQHGVAGLVLNRVDQVAQVPVGTCRARYHTRRGLVAALLEASAESCRSYLVAVAARYPGDTAAAVADLLTQQMGPGRQSTRALWAALMDPGVRPDADLYADALLCVWDRDVADLLGLTLDQYRLAWPMLQGLVSHTIMRALPAPDRETLTDLVRTVLRTVARSG